MLLAHAEDACIDDPSTDFDFDFDFDFDRRGASATSRRSRQEFEPTAVDGTEGVEVPMVEG